jgi:hypothetical protein
VADSVAAHGGSECNLQPIYEEWKKQYSAKILRLALPLPPSQQLSPLPVASLFERKNNFDLVRVARNVATLLAYVKECHTHMDGVEANHKAHILDFSNAGWTIAHSDSESDLEFIYEQWESCCISCGSIGDVATLAVAALQ